jgi:hypothetical protein
MGIPVYAGGDTVGTINYARDDGSVTRRSNVVAPDVTKPLKMARAASGGDGGDDYNIPAEWAKYD